MSSHVATPVLELHSGDRMTRAEFHRACEANPRLQHVELIEGVVYMPSPIRFSRHAEAQALVLTWLGNYAARTQGVRVGGPVTLLLDSDNEPEPDAVLLREAAAGGQSRISTADYVEGPPELVVEIAASSRAIDLAEKYRAYRRNGVTEYLVWVTGEHQFRWFVLRDGDYRELTPGEDGIIESIVFPGLRLDVAALLRGDIAMVLAK